MLFNPRRVLEGRPAALWMPPAISFSSHPPCRLVEAEARIVTNSQGQRVEVGRLLVRRGWPGRVWEAHFLESESRKLPVVLSAVAVTQERA